MRHTATLEHRFVEFIPNELEDATLYVSIPYATAAHKCCCGCGKKVVTPITPTDWKLTYDGETVSLNPSIGNWGFMCRSHYWIDQNRAVWARQWSSDEIEAGRVEAYEAKQAFFGDHQAVADGRVAGRTAARDGRSSRWARLTDMFRSFFGA